MLSKIIALELLGNALVVCHINAGACQPHALHRTMHTRICQQYCHRVPAAITPVVIHLRLISTQHITLCVGMYGWGNTRHIHSLQLAKPGAATYTALVKDC